MTAAHIRCPQCGYTLHDVAANPRCPECGFNHDDARLVIPAWRDAPSRWNAIFAGITALLGLYLLIKRGPDPLQVFVTAVIAWWFIVAIRRYRRAARGDRELVLVATDDALLLLGPDLRRLVPLEKIKGVRAPQGMDPRGRIDFTSPIELAHAALLTSMSMRLWLDADAHTTHRLEHEIARLRARDGEEDAEGAA